MAKIVLKQADVVVNGVDLSDHVAAVTLNYNAELQDDTAMQGNGTRSRVPGLLDWNFEITFQQDFAAGKVDATLFSLVGADAFTITVIPTENAASATNPSFSGQCVLETYQPMQGTVGELSTVSATFQAAGVLTRGT